MATDPDASGSGEADPLPATEAQRAQPPTIHEAELASGASGIVNWGAEIDLTAAVARRLAGLNVVVRGDDLRANRHLAEQIERAVGPCRRQEPHKRHAGPWALPHYQQEKRDPPPPGGHTFYETPRRKARRKP
jgi:hypothetical protein